MKLHTNTNTIEKSASFVESNYTIDATAKAFSILSDGLYSNKIRAVVRELSTNAYDSHIAAGCKDKPFDLQLPTTLDNTFSIRDYGIGLSQEDCMSLYTTYFRSDKTDSNDAVGCLGLGSKSPFAYTDQFMVESFFNGLHMTFSAYKNENDAPVFAMLSSEDTDEPNGLKVSFATKGDDKWEFESESEGLYKNFEVEPNCNVELDIERPEVTLEGSNWKVLEGEYENFVIMGQVSYPIDIDQFDGAAHDLLMGCRGIQITAGIGDVDITPSRESLSYNSRTKENLHRFFNNMLEEISDKLSSAIAGCPTLWDARLKMVELNGRLSKIPAATDRMNEVDTWNGELLFPAPSLGGSFNFFVELDRDAMTGDNGVIRFSKSAWRATIDRDDVTKISVSNPKNFAIMFENIKRGSVGRVRLLLKDEWGEGSVFLIRGDESYLQSVLTSMGATRDHVKNVSELPAPPKQYSTSGGGGTKSCHVMERVPNDDSWRLRPTKVSVKEEDAFFFRVSRDTIVMDDDSPAGNSVHLISRILRTIEKAGTPLEDFEEKVFIVTPSTAKTMKLAERDNWTDAAEYFKSEIAWILRNKRQMFIDKESAGYMDHTVGTSRYGDMSWESLHKIADLTKTENDLKDLSILARDLTTNVEEVQMVKDIKHVAVQTGAWTEFKEEIIEEILDLDEKYDIMISKYPMVALTNTYYHDEEEVLKTVARYIDTFKEQK
jgi:hypothetical protein